MTRHEPEQTNAELGLRGQTDPAYVGFLFRCYSEPNIGAAAGDAAAAPGTVSANTVAFGAGTGTLVFNHTSSNYVFAPAITGAGTIDVLSGSTILAGDLSQFTGSIDESGGNVTTAAAQQASVASLAASQQAAAVESHATAGELLGMTRPVTGDNYAYAGGLFGSAVGYAGAQYARDRVTLLGGLAYGAEDYPNVRQGSAPTVAAALRYMFADPFGDKLRTLHPYAEIGTWVTPRESLTLTRDYADFATGAPLSGQGSTNATSWAEYGRAGLVWQADPADQLAGYGELGQQFMHFEAYSEGASASNPFPVSVGAGLFRMGVARMGGAWTRDLSHDIYAPWSLTLAGDVARSFDVHSGLTASIPGLSPMEAPNQTSTWGEFGARLETQFTDQVAFDLDLTGTTGGPGIGTTLHGGGGVSYRF
jgi:hypothetical protein